MIANEVIPWFGRGYQVRYTAPGGDKIEYGFVTSGPARGENIEYGFVINSGPRRDDMYFVRYWNKDLSDLRTKANSEMTPADCLVQYESVPQKQVEEMLEKYC